MMRRGESRGERSSAAAPTVRRQVDVAIAPHDQGVDVAVAQRFADRLDVLRVGGVVQLQHGSLGSAYPPGTSGRPKPRNAGGWRSSAGIDTTRLPTGMRWVVYGPYAAQCRSDPQIPHASTSTSTSPGRQVAGRGIRSTQTAAADEPRR
jgi:hypothetical protein